VSDVERMDAARDRLIYLSLAGFLVWQAGDVARQVFDLLGAPRALRVAAIVVGLLGAVAWACGLVLLRRWMRRLRANPSLVMALEDEVVRDARLRAFAVGFFATIGALAVVTVVGAFFPFSARLAGQLSILVAVSVSLSALLHFRRRIEVD